MHLCNIFKPPIWSTAHYSCDYYLVVTDKFKDSMKLLQLDRQQVFTIQIKISQNVSDHL